MEDFKYPLGARLRGNLVKYRVIGHTLFLDGSRAYQLSSWMMHSGAGVHQVMVAAIEVEDETEMKEDK